jgi:hypothetical protein
MEPRRHLILPDPQVKPGNFIKHLAWAGHAAVDYKADVISIIGDLADMPSLSMHEKPGSKHAIGRNIRADFDAVNEAFAIFNAPIVKEIERLKNGRRKQWNPERHYYLGNHENRITNALDAQPSLVGLFGLDSILTPGFKRHPFLKINEVDGIKYCHYFPNPFTGRAYSGTIVSRLNNIGASFVQGHQQGFLYASKQYPDHVKHGLVAGRYYAEHEHYRAPDVQNSEFNGIVILNEVRIIGGSATYDLMPLSYSYLQRKYD